MVTGVHTHGGLSLAAALRAMLARGLASGGRQGFALAASLVACGILGGIFGEGAGIADRASGSMGSRGAPAIHDETSLSPVHAHAMPSGGETIIAKQLPLEIRARRVRTTAIVLEEPAGSEPAASPMLDTGPAPQHAGMPVEGRAAHAEVAPLQHPTVATSAEALGVDQSWSVQLASERSESQALAAFEHIQNEHQAILRGLQPQITKAELGAKGIYYRVRVGAESQEAANRLCANLQAAGGRCWVRHN